MHVPDLTLYQFGGDRGVESGSPFCAKVHRALAFKGLAYRTQVVASPGELARLNPGIAKVPVLSYDGELVADSTRILDLLEERHPDPPLWPADREARAQARLLEDWADESLYWFAVYYRWEIDSNFRPFAERAFGRLPLPLRLLVPRFARRQARSQLRGQGLGRASVDRVGALLDGHLDTLSALLGDRRFLVGEALTGADIAVFAPLKQLAIDVVPEAAALVRARESLLAWLGRVDEATTGEHTVALPVS